MELETIEKELSKNSNLQKNVILTKDRVTYVDFLSYFIDLVLHKEKDRYTRGLSGKLNLHILI